MIAHIAVQSSRDQSQPEINPEQERPSEFTAVPKKVAEVVNRRFRWLLDISKTPVLTVSPPKDMKSKLANSTSEDLLNMTRERLSKSTVGALKVTIIDPSPRFI